MAASTPKLTVEDGSKYMLSFVLDRIELTMTLDDFRTIFQLPQATNNNHERLVVAPKFLEMIMQMLYCVVNNVHVDYANLLSEGLHYSLEHPSTLIPYPRFTKIIVRKNKAGVGMKIPSWMITDEMKLTKNYQMYAEVFGVDVPTLNHSRLSVPRERIGQLASLCHLTMMWMKENQVLNESLLLLDFIFHQDGQLDSLHLHQSQLLTRLDPGSYKESLEVEKIVVEQHVNVIEEEDESANDDYELRRRVKGKNVEESRHTPSSTPIRSPRTHYTLVMEESLPNMVDDRVKELTKIQVSLYLAEGKIMERKHNQADVVKMIVDTIQQKYENLRAKITLQIKNVITNHIPSQVDSPVRTYISFSIRPRDHDDPYDDAHHEGENSAKRQKTSEHRTYVFRESSSGQANESEPCQSTSGNQEQLDDFDFWMDTYATADDKLPAEKVSQELMEEMLETVDEAKLHKVVDEMLRQRCSSGDEHQYHIDQMQNFLKNDIMWERHEHKFVTEFIARRENDSIVSITKPDYKNLNKNDSEDMYLLCINGKVDDYAEAGLL
nr:hypothetical protein [Tanacetum cinerariifolium]